MMLPGRNMVLISLLSALPTQSQVSISGKTSAEIRGRVVDRSSGVGVPDAVVQASRPSHVINTRSDSEGRYVLTGIADGDYVVVAMKDGLGGGRHLTVTKGLAGVSDFDVKIPAGSVIAGHISEADGTPAINATVELWQRYFRRGMSGYAHYNSVTTNEQGDYRMTTNGGGEFCISASRAKPSVKSWRPGTPAAQPVERPLRDVTTYYPSTTAPDSMLSLALRSGQELDGIDVKLIKTRTYCAAAHIQTRSRVGISIHQDAPGGSIGPVMLDSIGSFQICDLAPGTYHIGAQILTEDFGEPANFAEATFTIGREDVSLGDLEPALAISQKGHLKVLGDTAATVPAGMTIQVEPSAGDRYGGENLTSAVEPSGDFALPRLFVRQYSLDVQNLPKGYYVKYATIRGREALAEPFRAGDGDLDIGLAKDGGSVTGLVVDSDDHPVTDCPVVLTPDPLPATLTRTQVDVAYSDQNGQFKFNSVRPGKHLLYAVSGLEFGYEQNPEFLHSHSQNAQELKVEASQEAATKVKAEFIVD